MSDSKDQVKTVATNRKAQHDYFIEDSFEAGIVLTGTEIKSIRDGRVNLRDSFAMVREGELWLMNVHIAPYERGTYANHEPRRSRKLLLHRRQINRIAGQLQEKGLTLVPLRMYLKNNLAKVELGLARGKKQYDKRATLRDKQSQREIDRALARHAKES
jgi:SsrA-binding protein